MRQTVIVLASLGFIAYAIILRSGQRYERFTGWRKLFGFVAVVLAVLILLNPDLQALGLLGDTSVADVLAMALSLQMLVIGQWACRGVSTALVRGARWLGIPSPGLRLLIAFAAVAIASACSLAPKGVHRILS